MRALYAGSFDPPHNGHLWVIEQATALFGTVVVAIMDNADKTPFMQQKDRAQLLHLSLPDEIRSKVEIVTPHELRTTHEVAYDQSCNWLLRGLRGARDVDYEKDVAYVNSKMGLKSMLLIPPPELEHVSSSLIRGQLKYPGLRKFILSKVPFPVQKFLGKYYDLNDTAP